MRGKCLRRVDLDKVNFGKLSNKKDYNFLGTKQHFLGYFGLFLGYYPIYWTIRYNLKKFLVSLPYLKTKKNTI